MPRLFGRKAARSSAPAFTWEPEGRRRPRRFIAVAALTVTLGGLGYGAAVVADYLRTPASRTAAVAPVALDVEATAANGSDASAQVAAQPSQPQSTGALPKEPIDASAVPSSSVPASQDRGAADAPAANLAVLNAGSANPPVEAEANSAAPAKAPAAEKASRSAYRGRTATARTRKQRYERRLAVRQRRAPGIEEVGPPWRFAPALRADAGALRREDGRGPLPFAPRYYRHGEIPD